jgi:integrase
VGNARLRDGASTSVNVTVGKRSREYLTEREVERLIEAAKQNRSGHRDATAILVAYCHGLGASEVVVLRWDDSDLTTGRLHVRRAKAGDASVHPISARESRALRKLLRESPASPYVFISERRAPLSAAGYQRIVAASWCLPSAKRVRADRVSHYSWRQGYLLSGYGRPFCVNGNGRSVHHTESCRRQLSQPHK